MKSLIVMILISVAGSAMAENWQPLVKCEGESIVFDGNADGTRGFISYQLVVKNENVIADMISSGIFPKDLVNDKNEIIFNFQYYPKFGTFSLWYKGQDSSINRAFSLENTRTGSLNLKVYHFIQFGELNGSPLGEWTFSNCF